jgi:hypothetical protein
MSEPPRSRYLVVNLKQIEDSGADRGIDEAL